MSRVSVVIVSFNTAEKLRRCLECVQGVHEVLVVDNASTDGSPEMVEAEFPSVTLIRMTSNLGFGAANNVALDRATGDLVLYLNSDAYAEPHAIERLAEVFQDPAVVAAGGKLLNPDRTLQESIAGRLTLPMVFLEQTLLDRIFRRANRGYWRTKETLAKWNATRRPVPVEQVMGACLMVRRSVEERFDERFFLYCEDTDLCLRIKRHGQIVYFPPAEFIHDLGSSSSKDPSMGIIRYNWGKELYFRIHHGIVQESTCRLLNRLGALLRIFLWIPRSREKAGMFLRVLTAPRRYVR